MAARHAFSLILFLLAALSGQAYALDEKDVLPQEQAYPFAARIDAEGRLLLAWDIVQGYYLYRNKFKFTPKTPGISLGEAIFPPTEKKHDEFFGEMEIYRGHLAIPVPLTREDPSVRQLELEVRWQGCADAGICYPPFKQRVMVDLPQGAAPADTGSGNALYKLIQPARKAGGGLQPDDLLPADQAFQFLAEVKDERTLRVSWQIAEGYYLYRDRFRFSLAGNNAVTLDAPSLPKGTLKQEEDGPVEVFYGELAFDLPLRRADSTATTIELNARYQGCAEKGVCYPPVNKTVSLEIPPGGTTGASTQASGPKEELAAPEQDRIAASLKTDSTWLVVASFLGFGLLMAFSPCIFPMIPILSGIIVGQGHAVSTGRAFMLSLSYVLAAAAAYTVFGVLAGLFGSNLQAIMQAPAVIGSFSALFAVLALSMFGLFELQVPLFIQERVALLSRKQKGGTLLGAAVMGALSALLVGPCMAAPLAGALIYIGQTGDAVLGGLALFALGLGMGVPLLIIGASAGKLLPKAGVWMEAVKSVFGVGMLAVAVGLLERILPTALSMLLWALLLIVSAIYMHALDALPQGVSGWRKLWKGLGVAMLAYGILLLIGVATDSDDPRQPLRGLAMAGGKEQPATGLQFRRVKSVAELEEQLAAAKAAGRWVMLDYYADWCVSCKEMERYTFRDGRVQARLADVMLLKADVTDNSDDDSSLLSRYGLLGPPATLFFAPDGTERKQARLVGYLEADPFLSHLQKVLL